MDGLFSNFSQQTKQKIKEAFERSPGNELSSKFGSRESSAALAANTFGFFVEQAGNLPPIPGTADFGWPATAVRVEECVRFPWSGGRHPWLDALVETEKYLIGIESKRYEPYRGKPAAEFSVKYWSHDWGSGMKAYTDLRDKLRDGQVHFEHFNAVQLIKHAFGLITQARKQGKSAALVYLYAEPEIWVSDNTPIAPEARLRHASEAQRFASMVSVADVTFRSCSYKELLSAFRQSGDPDLSHHALMVAQEYNP